MFEKLSLEGAQAGLSWLTILRKREAYRRTFFQFDVDQVAAMTSEDVQAILDTPKTVDTRDVVVKHRGKI
ncbi:MAG: DNA-3-methyladenine glycosylase I, partial [Vibrio sp.]|nr:DNA-3-methyladenine glycosylase I [Vibrio sp.]